VSTKQSNGATLIGVDPSTADVLRRQTLVTLEADHHLVEDLREFGPEAQFALSVRYRDAFAVLDAIGWRRPEDPPASVDVPMTPGFTQQILRRRYDLDRLATRDAEPDPQARAEIDAAIAADRAAAITLDDLIAYATAAF